MSVEHVNPAELAKPSGFSHAVVAEGRVIFLAGQTATDSLGAIAGKDIVEQFERALANLLAALRAAGGSPGQLTSLTIYATDLADYRARGKEIGAVWRRLIGRGYPAMAAIGVSRLWDEAALVEIAGFAVIAPPAR
ncbi:MAG TPA: RidA family protein [Streptosporangiaceae bacterium]|nr:RidA family protein [Streptosporangiaceae bacterium]